MAATVITLISGFSDRHSRFAIKRCGADARVAADARPRRPRFSNAQRERGVRPVAGADPTRRRHGLCHCTDSATACVRVLGSAGSGGYFDQIVLSGISPLRFVIGKAASQNLFLGLILFLLLPYFVLSVTLGGVSLESFVAGLVLVWLYCMALAMVTLWAALYLNDLLAAVLVIAAATTSFDPWLHPDARFSRSS